MNQKLSSGLKTNGKEHEMFEGFDFLIGLSWGTVNVLFWLAVGLWIEGKSYVRENNPTLLLALLFGVFAVPLLIDFPRWPGELLVERDGDFSRESGFVWNTPFDGVVTYPFKEGSTVARPRVSRMFVFPEDEGPTLVTVWVYPTVKITDPERFIRSFRDLWGHQVSNQIIKMVVEYKARVFLARLPVPETSMAEWKQKILPEAENYLRDNIPLEGVSVSVDDVRIIPMESP